MFDMCEVGGLKIPRGNAFLRKRTVVYTTSRKLHLDLEARYCRGNYVHELIRGQQVIRGHWTNVSAFAANYTRGFARQVARSLKTEKGVREKPLLWDELCSKHVVGRDMLEQHCLLGEVLKRRRLWHNQEGGNLYEPAGVPNSDPELPHNMPSGLQLRAMFHEVEERVPRLGAYVVDPLSPLFLRVQAACPEFRTRHVEVCRGKDRYRIPGAGTCTKQRSRP